MSRKATMILMLLLGVSIIVLLILNLLIGSVRIPVGDVIDILLGSKSENPIWTNIVLKSRLPQSLTAVMAGAGLAVSGLLMQTVFRNPLAGPSVLGISSGASLGVACVVLLSGSIGSQRISQPEAIKRESGERPEQTRYCMFHINRADTTPVSLTGNGREGSPRGERVRRPAVRFCFNNLVD